MPLARVLSADSPSDGRLHLLRLGLPPARAREVEPEVGACQLLVTGADVSSLAALSAERGVRVVLGDPERARGAALVEGSRRELEALSARLAAEGPAKPLAQALARALHGLEEPPAPLALAGRRFEWGRRTYLVGIVNVTPDSFSDGGRHACADAAVAHGLQLAEEGADLIDVGGESTRPGAAPVPLEEELRRVVPVIEALARRSQVPLSVDTTKARVAEAAVAAGASLVNDISGFRFDPEMAPAIAHLGVAACAMHVQGTPATMQVAPRYLDLLGEVLEGLEASLELACRCGVPRERLLVDPGIGFGKTAEHNLFLLRHLRQLGTLGAPILVGASRKAFLGKLTGLPVDARLPGSLAALAAAALGGAHLLRVHDVAASRAALQVLDAVRDAREGGLAFVPGG